MTTYIQTLDSTGVHQADPGVDVPALLAGVVGGTLQPVRVVDGSAASYVVLGTNYSILVLGTGITYDDAGNPNGGKLTSFVVSYGGVATITYTLSKSPTVAALNAAIAEYASSLGAVATQFNAIFSPGLSFTGAAGADSWRGTALDDTLQGGGGADTLDGGANTVAGDWVGYSGSTAGVTIDLSVQDGVTAQVGGGDGAGDVLVNFENLKGSGYADVLSGNALANAIEGGGGDDTIRAGSGNDTLSGGTGTDLVTFEGVTQAVRFSLAVTTGQSNGALGSITASGFEALTGGTGDDTLTGSSGANRIRGLDGSDRIDGGAGADTLEGGANGADGDTVTYAASLAAVQVSLALQDGVTAQTSTGDAAGDVLTGIENLAGSGLGDRLTGDGVANRLDGGVGNDTIVGGAGNDTLIGGAGADSLDGGDGRDAVSFETAASGVTINFSDNSKNSGTDAAGDVYLHIEDLTGSGFADRLTGDGAFDLIAGLGGNDTIEGVGGGDTLSGGAGADTVSYSLAAAGLTVDLTRQDGTLLQSNGDLLTGFENVVGSGLADRLVGTNRDTAPGGTSGANLIDGGGGNDTVEGGTGDDTLIGGAGQDLLSFASLTAPGADGRGVTIDLSQTAAQASNAGGRLVIAGFEDVRGTQYDDRFVGTAVANVFDGGTGGIDCVSYAGSGVGVSVDLANTSHQMSAGTAAGDVLIGIENLVGSSQGDALRGDNLADNVIEGGLGNDTLDGGGSTNGTIGDTVSYAGATAGVTVSLDIGTAQNTVGAGIDVISHFENITGSAFKDVLTGDGLANRLTGGLGDDSLRGGDGADTLDGGANTAGGDWALYDTAATAVQVDLSVAGPLAQTGPGAASGDVLIGIENLLGGNFGATGAGNGDTLVGGATDNKITGGAGDDLIAGGDGNDVLLGGSGNDTLDGGNGNDTLDGGAETGLGGPGRDWATYAAAASAVTVSLAVTAAQNTLGAGIDKITAVENLQGSGFDDRLTGSAGANVIMGGDGNDTIAGGLGADTIWGGTAAADGGIDVADYSAATSAIVVEFTASQIAIIGGGAYALGDELHGIEGIIGTGFADTFFGSSGAEAFYGGAGNDLFYAHGGGDTIVGGAGLDTADFSDGAYDASGVTIDLAGNVNGTGAGASFVSSSLSLAGIEKVVGSVAADALAGDALANILQGGGGADTLSGGAGNDTIEGGFGNDRLVGQAGADTLTGGAGADTFVLQAAADKGDHVTDFSAAGGDLLEVSQTGFGLAGRTLGVDYDVVIGAAPTAGALRPTFLYNTATGVLAFDADGKGIGAAQALLTLDGYPSLTATSLVVA